jgi:hypothetical protein
MGPRPGIAAAPPTRRLRWLALALALQASAAFAIDFGPLVLHRDAQQDLLMQLRLSDRAPLDAAALRVRLAHRDAYASLGLDYAPALAAVEASVQASPDGSVMVQLRPLPLVTTQAQALNIVLIVFEGATLHTRRYRIDSRLPGAEFAAIDPTLEPAAAPVTATAPKAAPEPAPVPATPRAVPLKPAPSDAEAPWRTEVAEAVARWARAWASRDVEAYAAAYEADFRGAMGAASNTEWRAQRRERILSRRSIEVDLSDMKIDLRGTQAEVLFTQRYRGDALRATDRKRLLMVQRGSAWLIREEVSL